MEVKALQEQSLIHALWHDSKNPLLIRLLERMINFNTLTESTLVLIFHLMGGNEIIKSKLEQMTKLICENCGNRIPDCLQECIKRCQYCNETSCNEDCIERCDRCNEPDTECWCG